jgi:Fic family protein
MAFEPKFTITPRIANSLMRIEAAKQVVQHLAITPSVLASLRESSRLFSTLYSTMIEGNRLTQQQVTQVIGKQEHFPGRERDEKEVLGYYAALAKAEQLAAGTIILTEQHVQKLHALVMAGGGSKVKPSVYRDGQNVIRDGRSRAIDYMPPEPTDVPGLMHDMVAWIKDSEVQGLPCPIRAGIAHYQFATIHPYCEVVHPVPTRRPESLNRLGRTRLPARCRSCEEEQEIRAGE